MAVTVAKQKLIDGVRIAVVKYTLISGAASDVTNQSLTDISVDLSGTPDRVKIMYITATVDNFAIDLHWDATTDLAMVTLPAGENIIDARPYGGLHNNAGVGITGDIKFSTRGVEADSEATLIIEYVKKDA